MPAREKRLKEAGSPPATPSSVRVSRFADRPWHVSIGEPAIVAPATPTATDAAVVGDRPVVLEPTHLRVFGPAAAVHQIDVPPATRNSHSPTSRVPAPLR